jgi:hypothetical protein
MDVQDFPVKVYIIEAERHQLGNSYPGLGAVTTAQKEEEVVPITPYTARYRNEYRAALSEDCLGRVPRM